MNVVSHDVPANHERGISLLEMLVALAVLVPMILAVANTNRTVTNTVEANNRKADAASAALRATGQLGDFVRSAKLSSVRAPAIDDDVTSGRAATIGEWIPATETVWRPGLEFVTATGTQSLNGRLETQTRRIRFVLDSAETANGVDDDDDGLIDEGSIELSQQGVVVGKIHAIESCSIMHEDRLLRLRVRTARRDTNKLVHRASLEKRIYLRNN